MSERDSSRHEAARAGSGGRDDAHLSEDLAVDLLHDLLPPAEREETLVHLSVCPACERLFQEAVAARERLRATAATLPLAADVPSPPDRRTGVERPIPLVDRLRETFGRPRFRFGLIGAAALLVLLVLPRPLEREPDESRLFPLPAYRESLELRAPDDSAGSEDLREGLEAYARGDHARAVERLEGARAAGTLETVRRIYLGSSLLRTGRNEDVVEVLSSVALEDLPEPWGRRTRWALSVALERTGDAARADSLRRRLAEEPGEVGDAARARRR